MNIGNWFKKSEREQPPETVSETEDKIQLTITTRVGEYTTKCISYTHAVPENYGPGRQSKESSLSNPYQAFYDWYCTSDENTFQFVAHDENNDETVTTYSRSLIVGIEEKRIKVRKK